MKPALKGNVTDKVSGISSAYTISTTLEGGLTAKVMWLHSKNFDLRRVTSLFQIHLRFKRESNVGNCPCNCLLCLQFDIRVRLRGEVHDQYSTVSLN